MSNDEIVRELIEAYKARHAGAVCGWYSIQVPEKVRAEFDRRLRDGWWGVKYKNEWLLDRQMLIDKAAITYETSNAMKFVDKEGATNYALEKAAVCNFYSTDFHVEQFLDC